MAEIGTTELPSERYWRLSTAAEERANAAAWSNDQTARDRHNARAGTLADQAREAERQGR